MQYGFWDYFWGWLILACFLIPAIAAVLIQVSVVFITMFAAVFGTGGSSDSSIKPIKTQAQSYDEQGHEEQV
jgi:hypothetical protein